MDPRQAEGLGSGQGLVAGAQEQNGRAWGLRGLLQKQAAVVRASGDEDHGVTSLVNRGRPPGPPDHEDQGGGGRLR